MKSETEMRKALVHFSREAVIRQLSNATAGNLSIRFQNRMLITPSGVAPDHMNETQIVDVAFDGSFRSGLKPSSEWALHAAIYGKRPEVQAIVHAHPTYCVALSVLREPMPPFHYMVAAFGGNEVPCAPYRTFGGPALAEAVVNTMGVSYSACFMANHGMIAVGDSIETAFNRTEKLEVLARQYQLARTMGEIILLSDEEMAEVHEVYKTYGYGKPVEATS